MYFNVMSGIADSINCAFFSLSEDLNSDVFLQAGQKSKVVSEPSHQDETYIFVVQLWSRLFS